MAIRRRLFMPPVCDGGGTAFQFLAALRCFAKARLALWAGRFYFVAGA
jgi:hypothetical protein